ncbi:MAG: XdhC and CoxI family [Rhodobacteraceae bacterium HLUCCA12]|nr:MAG: XdhC and CoxI family [Rhodobacteraceae bacterium HLUCCA12]
MLRLNIKNEPRWLDCGHGVRLQLKPATSSIMVAARRDPMVRELLPDTGSEDEVEAIPTEVQDALAVAMARAVARRCVIGWEGVGDEDGNPIPEPTPEGIDALIDVPGIFEVFQNRFLGPAMLLVTEKNGSAPSPSGTSAAVRTTARRARSNAKPAPKPKTRR